MKNIGRLPNEILKAHNNATIKLSPICCDTIKKIKINFDNILKQKSTTKLKSIKETIGESKKDFNISSGKICILCSITKLPNSGIGKNRYYNIDTQNDIKFLGNNKYQILIPGNKYSLPGILNSPNINIILEYDIKTGNIIYKAKGENKGTIILNKTNIINPFTIYEDKVAKTKINFRAQNKNFELILNFPIKSANNINKESTKIAA